MQHDSAPMIVNLSGALTIERASALRDEISTALAKADNVLLSLSLVEELDLACLQVFYAAKKSASSRGKELHFVGTVPSRVVKRLAACGLLHGAAASAEDFEAGLADFSA
jgi:anti-anti-sigma factor